MADNKSSLVQIHQDVLDVALQSLKVSVVSGGGGGGTVLVQNGVDYLNRIRLVYSTTNVTTGAWVELLASVGATAIKEIEIFDSSGETLELGIGAAASEVSKSYVFPGGNGKTLMQIPAGARLSIKAVSATASTGEILINLYG